MRVSFFARSLLVGAALLSSPTHALPWPDGLDDPCTHVRDAGTVFKDYAFTNVGGLAFGWDVAYPQAYVGTEDTLRGVVFIVNANGGGIGDYRALGEHLARQNFLVRLIERPSAAFDTAIVEGEMAATFDYFDLPPNFPVVLVGHSKGGGTVLEITRLYDATYNIDAVVSIAPNAEGLTGFFGSEGAAYLALYGSQDEDMAGTAGDPREGFMAYDEVNTESTTTATNQFVFVTADKLDKAMVYVYGADHSGFINHGGLGGAATGGNDYLTVADQFCMAKAYISGFLDWKLDGASAFRPMFFGEITPPSVAAMLTAEADYAGNAAGQPVQLFHQFSPRLRYVIANFESAPTMAASFNMQAAVVEPNAVDVKARHQTHALRLGWREWPWLRPLSITVPATRRTLASFDSLWLRIGQIDTGNALYANSLPDLEMMITLVDGQGVSVNRWLGDFGHIPGDDARSGGSRGHSHMNTIRIPLSEFAGLDLNDVRTIKFWPLPNTRGEVMIDNIEVSHD
jgi:hypothetical protein